MNHTVSFASTFLDWHIMAQSLPAIGAGLLVTVQMGLAIVCTGLLLGLGLALLRAVGIRPLNWLIIFTIDLFRAVPPLVIILLLYIGGPAAGLPMSGVVCTWLSLSLVLMAFAEETCWAGITAVPHGQWEAARSTGLGFRQALLFVVLPQALRLAVPGLTNRTISITKGIALGSVVAVGEILSESSSALSVTGNPSPLTLGAIVYVLLFIPVVVTGRLIERRWRQHPA